MMTYDQLSEIEEELDKEGKFQDEHWLATVACPRMLELINALLRDGVIVLEDCDE